MGEGRHKNNWKVRLLGPEKVMHLITYEDSYLEPPSRTLSPLLRRAQQPEKETESVVKLSQGPSSWLLEQSECRTV